MAPGAIFADAVPDAECVTVSEAEPLLIKEAKPLYSRGLWLLILSVVVLWLTAASTLARPAARFQTARIQQSNVAIAPSIGQLGPPGRDAAPRHESQPRGPIDRLCCPSC
eukprot:CAMPEP_0184101946 /NCGR_PEP_ID=MMETSP0974-20121125/13094_1 /TAXON_ID=483370 /ORGANISM="non described non described, Strain CCMP2097" /LENGTH=109 /DNA_ID=CAMNT_0026404889 /DNA_START=100 /DNA_END=427 /DNA_ORIENTATION=-